LTGSQREKGDFGVAGRGTEKEVRTRKEKEGKEVNLRVGEGKKGE